MGRVLVVAVACVFGALVTWLFVPTVQKVPVNPNMPVFTYDPDPAEREDTTAPKVGMITEEKRRTRAEQLIGKKLKYATDEVRSKSWYLGQGTPVIERAMDECYIVTNMDMWMEHQSAVAEGGFDEVEPGDKNAMLRKMQPSFRQARNCANVMRAYAELHNIKVSW